MSTENDLKDVDTEAGLESERGIHINRREEVQDSFADPETALRVEFEQAISKSAEERAQTPFQVAAMTHARMCNPALAEIDRISGGAAKRVLKYLIAYPFYVKELNAQDKQVEALAEICDRLVQSKFTMAMCQAIENEARVTAALKEQEDLIQELPADIKKEE